MKTRIGFILALTIALMMVSCDDLMGLFANPLVGTWKIERVYQKETEIVTFTDKTFEVKRTYNDTGRVQHWTGTYTSDDHSIQFNYLTNNGYDYSFLNVIKYTVSGDQLWLCWYSDGETYTKQ